MCNNNNHCPWYLFWPLLICHGMMSKNAERAFELAMILTIFCLYCANRFLDSFASLIPQSFLDSHFNDLCAGVMFPAYTNLLMTIAKTSFRVDRISRLLILATVCSLFWEALTPILLPNSTGDWMDAAMYYTGGLLYGAIRHNCIGHQYRY